MEKPFWLKKCISIKKIYYRNWFQCSYLGIWEEKRECKPFIICLQMHAPQRLNCGLIICSSSSFTLALAEGSGDSQCFNKMSHIAFPSNHARACWSQGDEVHLAYIYISSHIQSYHDSLSLFWSSALAQDALLQQAGPIPVCGIPRQCPMTSQMWSNVLHSWSLHWLSGFWLRGEQCIPVRLTSFGDFSPGSTHCITVSHPWNKQCPGVKPQAILLKDISSLLYSLQ